MAFNRAEAEAALGYAQNGHLASLVEAIRTFARGPVSVTAATLSLTDRDYLNRTIVANRAAGITMTLPPATGGGDKVKVVVGTTITAGGLIVKVANSSDVMAGSALIAQDAADTVVHFETASTSDTITGNGTTTGGIRGDIIELEDVASNLWSVRVVGSATGIEASPFSATV